MKRSTITKARIRKASLERGKRLRKEGPDEIDITVGTNIKRLRIAKDMTQEELGKHVGVRFQQIQKYEHAANRIAPSRLVKIAKALDTRVSVFFGEHNGEENKALDQMSEMNVAQALRYYMKLDDEQKAHIRKTMSMMIRDNEQIGR